VAAVNQSVRIGVDIGGTFTDLALFDSDRKFRQYKSPSTPSDPSIGVFRVLEKAAQGLGVDIASMLSRVDTLVIGTTVATNIMVEKHGARVGLLCTEGFRDTLAIRRGIRDNVWDLRRPHPQVIVPRHLRIGIPERIDSRGGVARQLDEAKVREAARFFLDQDVEAVSIAFFNSYLNAEHEQRAAEIVRELMPKAFVSISSEILPVMGEYERTSTAVINAFVGPKTTRYLNQLTSSLDSSGLRTPPWIMQSNGGLASAKTLVSQPVSVVLSGPAGGGAAASYWGGLTDGKGVIFFDMGGTSTDISFTVDGSVELTDHTAIEGYHIALPTVDIKTIGTGGGTIAQVDRGGMLRVGPRSAGAEPGPVAYGLGGSEPTVTDANLVMGRLSPDRFLGGEMVLDKDGAQRAMHACVADQLGLSVNAAALAIVTLANQNMSNAVREVASERGIDLRKLVLVAAGGGSGLHICEIARLLGVQFVYVPREASVACAFGMLQSDVRQDIVLSCMGILDQIDPDTLRKRMAGAAAEGRRALVDGGVNEDAVSYKYALDLRYRGQSWQIAVPLPNDVTSATLKTVAEEFHRRHDRLYGYSDSSYAIEIVNLRVAALSVLPRVGAARTEKAVEVAAEPAYHREVYLGGETLETVPIFDGAKLHPGHTLSGPAVIEEINTTVFVGRGDVLVVDDFNNFLIRGAGA